MGLFRELEKNPRWLGELASAQTVLDELSERVSAPQDLQDRVMTRLGVRAGGAAGAGSQRRSGYSRRVKWMTRSSALAAAVLIAVGAGAWIRGHVRTDSMPDIVKARLDTPASSLGTIVDTAGNEIAQRPGFTRAVSEVVLFLAPDDAENDGSIATGATGRLASNGTGIPVRVAVVGWWPDDQNNSDAGTPIVPSAASNDHGGGIVWAVEMTPGRAADFLDASPASTHVIGPYPGIRHPGQPQPSGASLRGTIVFESMPDTVRQSNSDSAEIQWVSYDSELWQNLDEATIGLLWGSGAWTVLDQPMIPQQQVHADTSRPWPDSDLRWDPQGLSLPLQQARPPLPSAAYPDFGATRKQFDQSSRR